MSAVSSLVSLHSCRPIRTHFRAPAIQSSGWGRWIARGTLSASKNSDRLFARFLRSNAHRGLDGTHKYFPVPDLARLGRLHDRIDRRRRKRVGQHNLDLELRQKIHRVFAAAIDLGMTLLTAETFDFGNRHPLNSQGG